MKYEDQFEERMFTPLMPNRMVIFQGVIQNEPGTMEAIKSSHPGHGEEIMLPDDCQFADNDLCYEEA